ncbi:uncharacterized protein [Nicotiana tomentosiformis]|uniref:uncharacterized protein n=1 Tax=Nicotiana tomentosiformis TaxID=4098 RepID=UPI00388C7CD7
MEAFQKGATLASQKVMTYVISVRKNVADNVVKQALAAWGDSSSKSEEDDDQGDSSMMAVESEAVEYDSIFALMAQSDNDEDDDDDDEVNFLDVQRNLKSYSPKKLMFLANILIDAYHSLINDKNALTVELGDIEHERDDLVVVVVDLKETIECVKKEKEALIEKVTNIEHERDDLLVVVVNLKDTIEELKKEGRHEILQKGNEVADETHLRLENEIKSVKSSLCVELEKNKQLREELGRVKSDLEKSLKWTWSSEVITAMYTSNGGNRQGIGFQREKSPYNPHSKYVTVPDNWLYTQCGNTSILRKPGIMESSQQWYVDSGCSKHMTGSTNNFFSLKALQGGSVSFGNGKKGYILGVERIGKSLYHSIENVYYMNRLKYSLLSVSQICDKGNKSGDLSCLSVVADDTELWHKRLGHACFTLLNKLVKKDLVCGLPKSSFKDHKVCDACVKGKHVRSSFKPKKEVSTSRPLDLLHVDLCGPMRVTSREGKRYIFVIVDDYSRFTWTLFLRTKDKTFQVFVAFVKRIQVKMSNNVVCIKSDPKFNEFCVENGITHNFSAPRTPQQNGVVEKRIGLLKTWQEQC